MIRKIVKDALILFTITLVAGLCLGFVEKITREPIARAKQEAKNKAYKEVFADAGSFEVTVELEEALAKKEEVLKKEGYGYLTIEEGVAAIKDEAVIGYIFTVTTKEGYGGEITLAVGVDMEGKFTGYEVLAIDETPGLGMKATEDGFRNQFAGKDASGISWTKTGASKANEIDAISGATITTKAVTGAINGVGAFAISEEAGLINAKEETDNE